MYESHFGLRQRPFRATPDSESYYPATGHERALAALLQAVADDEGFALLTGEPGTGKTLLCRHLLDRLGPDVPSAFLTNSHIPDRKGLLRAILYDLSIPHQGQDEQELRLGLTDAVLNNFREGRRTVLVIDEAQHLTPDLLEELRLWGNLESRHGKAVQVVLSAQPAIEETLHRPELAGFRQRLVVRVHLEPLSIHEAADYLAHHLRAAGGRAEAIVSDEALEVLARGSQGLPRLLNQAGHQALVLAYQCGAATVDAEAALEALALLGLDGEEPAVEETAGEGPASSPPPDGDGMPVPAEPANAPGAEASPSFAVGQETQGGPAAAEGKKGKNRRLFAPPRRSA